MALTTRPRPSWVSLSARTTSATFISDLRFSATGHYPQHLVGPAMHGTMPASLRPTVPIVRMTEHRSRRAATDPGRKFPNPGTQSPDCGIPGGFRQVRVVRPSDQAATRLVTAGGTGGGQARHALLGRPGELMAR